MTTIFLVLHSRKWKCSSRMICFFESCKLGRVESSYTRLLAMVALCLFMNRQCTLVIKGLLENGRENPNGSVMPLLSHTFQIPYFIFCQMNITFFANWPVYRIFIPSEGFASNHSWKSHKHEQNINSHLRKDWRNLLSLSWTINAIIIDSPWNGESCGTENRLVCERVSLPSSWSTWNLI